MIFQFVLCFILLFQVLLVYILFRNHKVYHLRGDVLVRVSKLAKEDVANDKDFMWRYQEFEKVSYNDMMYDLFKGFKPKHYWKNLSFLEQSK